MTHLLQPPPGWYPDMQNPQQLRYWDGTKWSEHTHAAPRGTVQSGSGYQGVGSPQLRWWQTWLAIVPGLLFCLPLGLVGLWRRPGTTDMVKALVTVGTVLVFGLALVAPDDTGAARSNVAGSSVPETQEPDAAPPPPPPPPEPVMAKVPAVTGSSLAQARRELREAGLRVGQVKRQPSPRPAGTVLGQARAKGTSLMPGSDVRLIVAVPFPQVPSVVGDTRASAIRQLRQAGFRTQTTVETRTSGQDGVVLRQGPFGGTRARPDSIVRIVIANVVRPVVSEPSNCTPGYRPCLAPAYDYDCSGGSGDGPAYTGLVYVSGSDPYDLDADGDGVACE